MIQVVGVENGAGCKRRYVGSACHEQVRPSKGACSSAGLRDSPKLLNGFFGFAADERGCEMGPHVNAAVFGDMTEVLLKGSLTILRLLRGLRWRHHALGMLQGELSPFVRIHIWDPELVHFSEGSPRAIHDHRFDLLSYVVAGELTDVHYDVRLGTEKPRRPGWDFDPEDWTLSKAWEIKHAKVQKHDASDFHPLGLCYYRQGVMKVFSRGEVYHIPRGAFHTTAKASAVTFVYRSNFGESPARVLGELNDAVEGNEPITGIIRSTEGRQIDEILCRAARLIEGRS